MQRWLCPKLEIMSRPVEIIPRSMQIEDLSGG